MTSTADDIDPLSFSYPNYIGTWLKTKDGLYYLLPIRKVVGSKILFVCIMVAQSYPPTWNICFATQNIEFFSKRCDFSPSPALDLVDTRTVEKFKAYLHTV